MTPAWVMSAACAGADPDLFFPGANDETAPAKRVCGRCQHRTECLEMAVRDGLYDGVFGGLSEEERVGLTVKKTCVRCGVVFDGTFARVTCSTECSRAHKADAARSHKGKA